MSNKRWFVTALLMVAMSFVASGVALSEDADSLDVFRAHVMFGGTTFDIDPLNERISDKGYTEFSDRFYSIGAGFFSKATDRLLAGVEAHLLVGEQKSSTVGGKNYSSSAIGGYGFLNLGYLVVENNYLDLYPVLGLGVGGVRFKIGQSSFDDILNTPYGPANMNTFSVLLNLALGADYKIKLPEEDDDVSYVVLGIRGGYALSLYDSGWYMDEYSLSGDPDGGIAGPYVRITIGGGPIPVK